MEEVEVAEVKNARVSLTGEKTKPMKLAEVTSINVNRTKTEMEEFNRVLGGGVVPGSLVLIGGRLNYVQSAWEILIVSFISMLRPICRA